MSDDSQDKKSTVPDVPSSKSYSADGGTAEFDPGALQAHDISPELRQQISEASLPRLDPKYLHDTAPPNLRDGAATTVGLDATTQPSLRRVQQAIGQPVWRRRTVRGLVALLSLALLWEAAVLLRTSFNQGAAQPLEPRTSVQISAAAPPRLAATPETAARVEPEARAGTAHAAEVGTATAPRTPEPSSPPSANPEAERAAPARSQPAASAPRAAPLSPDVATVVHEETSSPSKPEGAAAPQPEVSAKSPSRVLFPPQ